LTIIDVVSDWLKLAFLVHVDQKGKMFCLVSLGTHYNVAIHITWFYSVVDNWTA